MNFYKLPHKYYCGSICTRGPCVFASSAGRAASCFTAASLAIRTASFSQSLHSGRTWSSPSSASAWHWLADPCGTEREEAP
jgi:hypothetical protein